MVKWIIFGFASLILTGCSILNIFQGSFAQDDWEIEKIVVKNKEYLALGELKELALQKLQQQQKNTMEENQEAQQDENNTSEGNLQDFDTQGSLLQQSDEQETKEDTLQDLQELAQIDEVSTLRFDTKQSKIFGVAACNNFSADYSWKDADNIEIYEVNITRKLCSPSQVMGFELRFARNLKNIFFVEKKGKTAMILKNKDVQIFLKAR
ncbi:hypothetical protein CQA57_03145 [Helicobacter anseris]|uniref:DUF306 domain-containing protein n=1 Tax=Helicobacter anseris TaxID=375926 RepID=A0A3D8JB30_9HELI|nr:META domain-containing protein [Helicobacter anseris]RDU74101.1 hypothetical protein CQA57_03145 [Helicobacter anseris]